MYKMLRNIIGWVRIPNEDWEITMRRMKNRVTNAMTIYNIPNIKEIILRHKWNFAKHIKNSSDLTWPRLVLEWNPQYDDSDELVRRRTRGRPYLRWDDDIRSFCDEKWQSEEWIFIDNATFGQLDASEFITFCIDSE